MLNSIRNFANTKWAGVLVAIIIVPFAFWGMGSIFSKGNSNNIAKINNKSISTQDFMDHINSSNVKLSEIKDKIDENILDNFLTELISKQMINHEINDFELSLSDKVLRKKIKENKNFLDENNNFSRTKYEKFLLSNNYTAPSFEKELKINELQKNLFE